MERAGKSVQKAAATGKFDKAGLVPAPTTRKLNLHNVVTLSCCREN